MPQVPTSVGHIEQNSYPHSPDAIALSLSVLRPSTPSVSCPAQHQRYETEAQGRPHVSASEKTWSCAAGRCDYCAGDHRQLVCPVKVQGPAGGARVSCRPSGTNSNNPFGL